MDWTAAADNLKAEHDRIVRSLPEMRGTEQACAAGAVLVLRALYDAINAGLASR